jgi:RND family efflux transporter MFP subunit
VDGGAMLKANDPIISLLDIAALKAVIYVTERDYPKLRTGQDVAVTTDAAPDRSFTGRIVRVASLLDQTSRQARVEVEVPNDDGLLKPGMFIRARVEFARQENALVIPASAFVKREGGLGFFVADRQAMKARFVAARSGIAEGDLAEILEPAQAVENALIVTLGQHLLEDGSPIAIPGEKPAPGPKAAEASQATPAPASPKGS